MGKSPKRQKRDNNMVDSEDDMGFSDEDYNSAEGSDHHDASDDYYDADDKRDDDYESDGGESDQHKENGQHNDDEIGELEKEYMDLRNSEQNLIQSLKRHKDEDVHKGQAVKNQKALWDKTLELRFLLQKAFSHSNRLPQEPVRSLFYPMDEVSSAYTELITSSKQALNSLVELQEALLENNPSIVQVTEGNSQASFKPQGPSQLLDNGIEDEWLQISDIQSRMASFRNKSVDKWHRKTEVNTGAAGKFNAFNQNISDQVSMYMRDPNKMLKGMQSRRETVDVFGSAYVVTNDKEEGTLADGDPELLDDSEFYQRLLKEFFETIDPNSSETAFYALKRMQTKKRKIVDRRASKGRKIRYHVHEKLVNFMAPQPMELPETAAKLFESLFGLKTDKVVPVA